MLMKWHDALSTNKLQKLFFWLLVLQFSLIATCCARRDGVPGAPHIAALRQETEELFYHGFQSYMKHGFPEDEVRPLSCKPLHRDRENPNHLELNDVLGNYSLTLVDTLSTLAILASSPTGSHGNKPLELFQNAVKDIVNLYGDGSAGARGQGRRARGFDLDSKVQVFETTIRGLGGLLSAHLFAVGELPITGYGPPADQARAAQAWTRDGKDTVGGIRWSNGLVYDGQLLRLAYDLGNRLVPAFWTSTGIPYPRVNLRHGIPFHARSAGNFAPEGECETEKKKETGEITENCSAGAGSLVLEFTVLSRLTNDAKFEELAKRAFWSIWNRRSPIDLIGAGIDAETGVWQHSWTGIGAGIDSFFEYAFKSHVLLSGLPRPPAPNNITAHDPRSLFVPLSDVDHDGESFLRAWDAAHAAIQKHINRDINFQHPHHIQVDLNSGASRAFWVDALSAYYPGLLAMSGHVEEGVEAHLVYTALWARFSALPERYNMATGGIEGGLGWWVGRPEMIESAWYLYRATEDPWYIYVGEMAMRDIKRRCWGRCGWTSIQNVLTGEKVDRMETFFLSETAKYLFLLFDPDHPLNKLDAPYVFSTEGHPLIIPRDRSIRYKPMVPIPDEVNDRTCPLKPAPLPLSISNVAARGDVYHAGSLARLHLMPQRGQVDSVLKEYTIDHPSIVLADVQSPSNWTYYPWTLPPGLVPHNATSSKMPTAPTFELAFPSTENKANNANPPLQRVKDGILVNALVGLRLSMIQDVPMFVNDDLITGYRVHAINNVALGKDEKVYLAQSTSYKALNPQDPLFTRLRDTTVLDIAIDIGQTKRQKETGGINASIGQNIEIEVPDLDDITDGAMKAAWNSILTQISDLVRDAQGLMLPLGSVMDDNSHDQNSGRVFVPAITPSGIGAAPLPDWQEVSATTSSQGKEEELPWTKIYAVGELCDEKLPASILRSHQIILIKRGTCSFNQKLSNIPMVRPNRAAFQLAIVVDYEEGEGIHAADSIFGIGSSIVDFSTRPLLDEPQLTSSGLPRQNLVPMVMVGGGEQMYEALKNAKGIGVKRRYSVSTQGIPIANVMIV
ncbi:hypothetical protein LTS08_007935 [Lithohypha guttulata]|nr:hypothetical protein LTS08_007935 [Lithohypha guttulata]